MSNLDLPFNEGSVYYKSMSGAEVELLRKKHNINFYRSLKHVEGSCEIGHSRDQISLAVSGVRLLEGEADTVMLIS